MITRHTPLRRIHRQAGVATVELALVLIPLMLMLFGITEFGRAFHQYNTLVKSVRNAARYLASQPAGQDHATALCLTVYAATGCSGTPVAPGLTTAMVSICDASTCPATHANIPKGGSGGVMNLVTVTITGYVFESSVHFTAGPERSWIIGTPDIHFAPISATFRQGS